MSNFLTLKLNHMLKKLVVCVIMLGIVFIAFASTGGGKKKKSSALASIPLNAKTALSLRTKPTYSGSQFLTTTTTSNAIVYRSVVTYQRGNTTYVIPSQFKLQNQKLSKVTLKSPTLSFRSNLNVIDLKIRLCNK